MTKPLRIENWYDFSNAVPVAEPEKEQWIEEAIKHLEDNPDEYMYYITSGDTLILVHKDDITYNYVVHDLKLRKEALFKFSKKIPGDCVCDTQLMISQGCQCGGK